MFKRIAGKKYNSVVTKIDGINFKSKIEARFYQYFKQNSFEIEEMQPNFNLQIKFEHEGKKYREINYVSDFLINIGKRKIIIEVKGFLTPEYKLKKKLFIYKLKNFEKEFGCKLYFLEVKSIKELENKLLEINS